MKPVLIFEHIESSTAGLFETFLKQSSIPFLILRPNLGDDIPGCHEISAYAGLCFLGGTESVTAPTDSMLKEIALIQAAKESGLPVIGHCLGGQLISKALGGEVTEHHLEEFGWSQLYAEDNQAARQWLGNSPAELIAMQWHSDVFSIPEGATKILSGDYCDNQAFVYGNMLAMQFHIEIDVKMIRHWAIELADKHPPANNSVQSAEQILDLIDTNFESSRRLAEQLYGAWIGNF